MGAVRSGAHPRGVHQARMPGVGQPLADTVQQLHAAGDGAVGAADGGHNHVAQNGEGVVVHLHPADKGLRSGCLEEAEAHRLPGIGREARRAPIDFYLAAVWHREQRVGVTGRVGRCRGAHTHHQRPVGLGPQAEVLYPRGGDGHRPREHVLARVVGIHDVVVADTVSVLVICGGAAGVLPPVDGPAGVAALEVVAPGQRRHRAAVGHLDHSRRRVAPVGVGKHHRDRVDARSGIHHIHLGNHRICSHYSAVQQARMPGEHHIAVHTGEHAGRVVRRVVHEGHRRHLPQQLRHLLPVERHIVDIGASAAFAGAYPCHPHPLAAPGVEVGSKCSIALIFTVEHH